MIKLIIFDIGGVLVDFTEDMYIHYLHEQIVPEVPERDLEKFILPLTVLMEYGNLSVPELEHMVGKHFGVEKLNLHWVEGYKRISKPMIKEIKLLNTIAKHYRVVLLSNVSHSRYDELKRSYLRLVKMKKAYTSYSIGLRKPGPKIYDYVLDAEKVRPNEAVFIDNQIENVLGAEKVGINAVWFRNYRKLVLDLKELGVVQE